MRLRYTRAALADLDSILDYISERSPQGAKRVQVRIITIIDLISRHPKAGTRTDDPSIRRMVVGPYPYLVFYEATPDALIIHAIRRAARDPSGMPGNA